MLDMGWIAALSQQLDTYSTAPPATPPEGELVLSTTSMSHAGGYTPVRASTPLLPHCPSPG
eukprot:5300917-Prorocentrum_lima.AAC.1